MAKPQETIHELVRQQFIEAGLDVENDVKVKKLSANMAEAIENIVSVIAGNQIKAIKRAEIMAEKSTGGYIGRDVEIFRNGIQHVVDVLKQYTHK